MEKLDWDANSRRTYAAAKKYILTIPENPLGEGFAEQMIDEAKKPHFKILGIGLLVLARALQRHPEQVDQARKIFGK